ncbi:MAG: tol-pal system protein YbgF [SAR86 cluster bacterium]|uniref:Cell division coordinator CpoB n=1 Tax=SAR86 cluster bacterium TaxID=2030880 RepID=A0A2A5CEQ0_9GAMM|nr:MAG: tol-pal system protein YbgF [SAR86 cluster bacterium]
MLKYASQLKQSLLLLIRLKVLILIAPMTLMALFTSSSVFSQVQVVEAGANNSSSSQPAVQTAANTGGGNEIIITLYDMVEALQREVQSLRGLVEEQTYQIRRMESAQRDRYLDVDNRLSELNQRMTLGVNGVSSGIGVSPQIFGSTNINEPSALESTAQAALNPNVSNAVISTEVDQTLPVASVNNNSQTTIALNDLSNLEPKTEEELYQEARNLLLNDGEFESSILVFQQMIEDYPRGRLAPNAYYWQGEALILIERYSQAINVFNQVVDNFPMHEKAPDAMLKLGIVYSLMENESRAQQVWRDLLTDFSGSGSASLRLAEVYLREGYNR